MCPPISGRLVRRLALLHFIGCRALPQRNDFPFLRLIRKFDRFDERVLRLACDCGAFRGDEGFCRVHFLPFVLKERTCSLHQPPREQVRSARKAPVSARAARQRSTKQWSATRHKQTGCAKRIRGKHLSRGARLRGATRGGGADGMNTTEILIGECRSLNPITERQLSCVSNNPLRTVQMTNNSLPNVMRDFATIFPRRRTDRVIYADPFFNAERHKE